MAIRVIAQRRVLKIGKNPGAKKFVMRPELYTSLTEKKVFAEAATHSGISAGVIKAAYLRRCDQGGLGCRRRSNPHVGDRGSQRTPARFGNHALRCAFEGCRRPRRREDRTDYHPSYRVHALCGCEGRAEEHLDSDHLSR